MRSAWLRPGALECELRVWQCLARAPPEASISLAMPWGTHSHTLTPVSLAAVKQMIPTLLLV